MGVFAGYMGILCVGFLAIPTPFVGLFGFPPPDPLWIRVFAIVLAILTFYYVMAIRERLYRFYRWTFIARLILFPSWVAFWLLGLAPPSIVAFGAFETGCAIWTGLALRREGR